MFPARSTEFLRGRLQSAQADLERLTLECGREPGSVQLLPVTKAVDWETTAHLHELGEREFAENRADALVAKAEIFAERGLQARWHFIGPLQRNKARRVLRHASVLHSVHSTALLEALARIAEEEQLSLELYLQVHLSGDDSKQGLPPEDLLTAAHWISKSAHLQLLGLMAMGPLEDPDGSGTQQAFQRCSELASDLQNRVPEALKDETCRLSMGMSRDIEWAVSAGTTLVRVGSALFR